MESNKLITKDLADLFNVDVSTIRRAWKKGKLPYPTKDRFGYNYWIKSELDGFIKEFGEPIFKRNKYVKKEEV